MPRRLFPFALAVSIGLGACGDATAPGDALPGTWDLIGFSDHGVAAQTTGTVEFRTDGTFEVDGTVTFPGEPTETLHLAGTWSPGPETVTLTTADGPSTWDVAFSGNEAVLTLDEPAPANTIRLRRA